MYGKEKFRKRFKLVLSLLLELLIFFKGYISTKDSFITQDRNDNYFEGGQVESTFS